MVDGIIINGFDKEEWVRKTIALIDDKQRLSDMKNSAGKKIKDSFLWDEVAERFIEEYYECIRQSDNGVQSNI